MPISYAEGNALSTPILSETPNVRRRIERFDQKENANLAKAKALRIEYGYPISRHELQLQPQPKPKRNRGVIKKKMPTWPKPRLYGSSTDTPYLDMNSNSNHNPNQRGTAA
jgi:hypothetical protein